MLKIVLTEGAKLPKIKSPEGFIFENARGGPYKYGAPIAFNAEAAKRAKNDEL